MTALRPRPGILPGVIGLTREGVTAFRLIPHFLTIARGQPVRKLRQTKDGPIEHEFELGIDDHLPLFVDEAHCSRYITSGGKRYDCPY